MKLTGPSGPGSTPEQQQQPKTGNGSTAAAKQRAVYLKQLVADDLYARLPRRVIERRMDRPPRDPAARKGWRTVESEETRVWFTYIRYSWCFPYCYEYAVQTQDGEVVYGSDHQPLPMTQQQVAETLGMLQPNVSQAIDRLLAKKLLRIEGRRVYPLLSPPELTPADRANYTCTDIIQAEDEPTLPASFLKVFNNIALPEHIRTDIHAAAVEICTAFNAELSQARQRKKNRFDELCTRLQEACTTPPADPEQPAAEACTRPPLNKERVRASDSDLDLEEGSTSSSPSAEGPAEQPTTTTSTPPPQESPSKPEGKPEVRPAAEAEALLRIRAALKRYGTPDPGFERVLWEQARAKDPLVDHLEICELIHEKGKRYDGRGFRFFLIAVSNALPLDRNEEIRRATTPYAADDPALERWRLEQQRALEDPAVPEQEKRLIRLCLGIPDREPPRGAG